MNPEPVNSSQLDPWVANCSRLVVAVLLGLGLLLVYPTHVDTGDYWTNYWMQKDLARLALEFAVVMVGLHVVRYIVERISGGLAARAKFAPTSSVPAEIAPDDSTVVTTATSVQILDYQSRLSHAFSDMPIFENPFKVMPAPAREIFWIILVMQIALSMAINVVEENGYLTAWLIWAGLFWLIMPVYVARRLRDRRFRLTDIVLFLAVLFLITFILLLFLLPSLSRARA